MKFKFLALALFPLALAACQSGDIQKAGDIAVSVLQQKNAATTLVLMNGARLQEQHLNLWFFILMLKVV